MKNPDDIDLIQINRSLRYDNGGVESDLSYDNGEPDYYEIEEGNALPNSLFTIKCSHLGWSNPLWNKHYLDVLFMKQKGCVVEEELYSTLKEFWKTELGDKPFYPLNKIRKISSQIMLTTFMIMIYFMRKLVSQTNQFIQDV